MVLISEPMALGSRPRCHDLRDGHVCQHMTTIFGVFGPENEHDLVIQLDSETALRCVWTMSPKCTFLYPMLPQKYRWLTDPSGDAKDL